MIRSWRLPELVKMTGVEQWRRRVAAGDGEDGRREAPPEMGSPPEMLMTVDERERLERE